MSELIDFLDQLRQRRISVWLEEGRLRYRAPKNALDPGILAELKARKADIMAFLEQADTQYQLPSLKAIDRQGPLPLSFAQKRLWFLQQLEPDSTANNMPVVVKFEGALDLDVLEQSIQIVMQRHEVLRACFPVVNGQPIVQLQNQVDTSLPVIDLRHLPLSEREQAAHQQATQAAHIPFDLNNGPVVRVKLFQLTDQTFLLIWDMHCIVCDGASSDIFYQDLIAAYRALSTGQPLSLPELPIQYVDFAHWQRSWLQGQVLEQQLNYWQQLLAGDVSSIRLPYDHPRPQNVQSYRGNRAARMLPLQLNQALNELSQKSGVTLFMTLLAAYQVLLHRYSSQTDLLINVASAGRGNLNTEHLLGFFSNTLLLRADLSENPTFDDLLQRVKQSALQAFAHQDLPFEKLVEELPSEQRQPNSSLFQVKFALNPPWSHGRGMAAVQLQDLTISSLFGYIYHGQTKYDLTLVMREQDEGLGLVFDYNAELFEADTAARMVEHLHTLLDSIVENPHQRISELPLLTVAERQLMPQPVEPSSGVRLHRQFEAQVDLHPDAIALLTPQHQLTYGELNSQANQLAHYLQAQGVIADSPLVIDILDPIQRVVAQLATLKAGGIYILVDAYSPPEYLDQALTDTPLTLLTQDPRTYDIRFKTVLGINAAQRDIQAQSTANLQCSTPDVACILFQQDDTQWRPIHLTHGGIQHSAAAAERLSTAATDRWLQFAPVTSERSSLETFAALLHGGQLVLTEQPLTITQLSQTIQQCQVTALYLPTRLFNALLEQAPEKLASINICLIGGDFASPHHTQQFLKRLPHSSLFNTYCLAENSGLVCVQPIQEPVSIQTSAQVGPPLPGTQAYILDPHHQPVPMGVEGDLYIGGNGLAQGAPLSSSSISPSFGAPWEDLLPTGERAQYRTDGSICLCGHTEPINLNGLWLRLSEMEILLNTHPLVKESKIVEIKEDATDPYYVAYVVAKQQSLTSQTLFEFLKIQLPIDGVSISFVVLEILPLTVEGEIALNRLPIPMATQCHVEAIKVAAESPLEKQLTLIWQEVLKVSTVGTTDNFFTLGGNSLLAISLAVKIEQELGKPLPLASFFQAPTIKEQIQILQQQQPQADWYSLVPVQPHGSYPPLFFVHFIFRPLTDRFGPEQPIYALRYGMAAKASDSPEENIPTQVEALAAHYIEEMQQVQPHGPYHLMGSSFGGTVAYEMARQLSEAGETVALLALFDSTLWDRPNKFSPMQKLQRTMIKKVQEGLPGLQHSVMYRLSKFQYYRKYKGRYTPHVNWDQEVNLFDAYVPKPYDGKVTLFNSIDQSVQYYEPDWLSQQWSRVVASLRTFDVPGTHIGMLQEPHVAVVADLLETCLEEARLATKDEEQFTPADNNRPAQELASPNKTSL